MRFICSQSDLATALTQVSRTIQSRPSHHPILADVLLQADKATGKLTITGFDLSLGMQVSIDATVEQSGATATPARLFSDIVNKLPSDAAICLRLAESELTITTTQGSYQVKTDNPNDYPDLPLVSNAQPQEINSIALSRALYSTLFCSSADDSKMLLTGINIVLSSAGIKCAATDGHRLAVHFEPCDMNSEMMVTIPSRSLKELQRVLVSHEQAYNLQVFYSSGQAVFIADNMILSTRVLDGKYPDYQQLIPESFKHIASIKRKAFLGALDRVSVIAEQHNNVAKVTLADGELTISVDAQDIGKCKETIVWDYDGEKITVGFNVRYLIEGLKTMSDEYIKIKCNTETTPVVFCGDNEDFTYLVMPVQVRN